MKILHINTHLTGGAAQAALAIQRGLRGLEVDAGLLVQVRGGDTDLPYQRIYDTVNGTFTRGFLESREILYKIKRNYLLSKLPSSPIWYSFPWSPYDLTTTEAYQKADVIHLHWVGELLDYRSFFKKNKKPIVWTLHDLNPVTGGQHSEHGFPTKYYQQLSDKMTRLKQKAMTGQRIHWVFPSKLHQERAEKYPLFQQFPSSLIPNGVDTDIFRPIAKEKVREILGLPNNQKIAFFIAYPDHYTLKGMPVMRKVMQAMEGSEITFICIGNIDVAGHPNCRSLGPVHDKLLLAQLYNASDLLLAPSLEESFGLTVLESLACGVPVLSFATGIAPEVILEGKNGWICPDKTADSMAFVLKNALNNPFNQNKETIVNQIVKFDWRQIAGRYLNLYQQILN